MILLNWGALFLSKLIFYQKCITALCIHLSKAYVQYHTHFSSLPPFLNWRKPSISVKWASAGLWFFPLYFNGIFHFLGWEICQTLLESSHYYWRVFYPPLEYLLSKLIFKCVDTFTVLEGFNNFIPSSFYGGEWLILSAWRLYYFLLEILNLKLYFRFLKLQL